MFKVFSCLANEHDYGVVAFAALVMNHFDFNNRRPLTVKGLAKRLDVRVEQIERWCAMLHIVLKKKGEDTILMTLRQAERDV